MKDYKYQLSVIIIILNYMQNFVCRIVA